MKIYIAGKISGLPKSEYTAFEVNQKRAGETDWQCRSSGMGAANYSPGY
jgi:hypothetical protein